MKKFARKVLPYTIAGVFLCFLCSLSITFALGANQMEITGQAWFMAQGSSGFNYLPMFPTDNGDGNYFTPNVSDSMDVYLIEQEYVDGDFYLSICSSNSNNGNQDWSIVFGFLNPTVYTWTNGTAHHAAWPLAQGGLDSNGFTFMSASTTPATLATNQAATVTLNMRSQLGKADTQGATIVTVTYLVNGQARDTRVYFKYYGRETAECPL